MNILSFYILPYLIPSFEGKAMILLGNFIEKEDSSTIIGAILGLRIAYVGSQNAQ
jgi:hypothetical protein